METGGPTRRRTWNVSLDWSIVQETSDRRRFGPSNKFGSAEKTLDALPELARGADRINLRLYTEDALRQIDDTQQVGGMMSHLGEPFPGS